MSVLRARFVEDEQHPCHDQESADAIDAVETVTYVAPADIKKDERRLAKVREEVEKARKKAHLATLDELAEKQPAFAPKVKMLARRAAEKPAMAAVERRLTCEGLLGAKGGTKHTTGIYDDAMRLAVRRFQQKHMIYEANYLRRKTVDALARPLVDNDYDDLTRALRERVVAAAAIVEDGSASKTRNLVDEYLKTALDQMQFTDGAAALAFFKRHPAPEFKRLRVAIKLPPRPDYYSDNMDLSIVVDRGDVWYDLPFDEKGHYKPQPRKKYPSLTLYTKVGGKLTPLARWRTTIGGWRSEQAANGYEYFRYKQSDVGPRVIRNVVSGPVWIAPASTPIRSLTKGKTVNGKWQRVVNYDELGPGYLSAYGLIAGYFVVPGPERPQRLRQRRARARVVGLPVDLQRERLLARLPPAAEPHRDPDVLVHPAAPQHDRRRRQDDELRAPVPVQGRRSRSGCPSRGYYYVLDPPLPVNVLEGEIKGDAKKPVARLRRRAVGQVSARPARAGRARFRRGEGGRRGRWRMTRCGVWSRTRRACRCSRCRSRLWPCADDAAAPAGAPATAPTRGRRRRRARTCGSCSRSCRRPRRRRCSGGRRSSARSRRTRR